MRTTLTPELRMEFASEWNLVLEQAKQSHSLEDIHALLNKWQHIAVMESRNPGSYQRMLDRAAQILARGGNPEGRTLEEMLDLIDRRRQAS